MRDYSLSPSTQKGAIMAPFLVYSYAKLNLSLKVYSPRKDGYHPICSVFQEVTLHDTLAIALRPKGEFSVEIPGSPLNGVPNILERVFHQLEPRLNSGYHITLTKRIPVGGGMGGGSSNAAAFLRWVVDAEKLTDTPHDLGKIAVSLGADVPFFLTGGTALVRGIGEKVTPITVPKRWYLLINPNLHADTGTIFRAYDQSGVSKPAGPTPKRILNGAIGENDFKAVVWQLFPALAQLSALVSHDLGKPLHLSGSGATVFLDFDTENDAQQAQQWLGDSEFSGYWNQIVSSRS